VGGQFCEVHAFNSDGIETSSYARRVETDFTDYAGFCYLGDCWFTFLGNFKGYEIVELADVPLNLSSVNLNI
jgi:hypothetical protein